MEAGRTFFTKSAESCSNNLFQLDVPNGKKQQTSVRFQQTPVLVIIKFNIPESQPTPNLNIDQQTDYLNCLLCKHCNWKTLSVPHKRQPFFVSQEQCNNRP